MKSYAKHREHLITDFLQHGTYKSREAAESGLNFLEHENQLLDDDTFDQHVKAGKEIPYAHTDDEDEEDDAEV